jgi:hypothetical protein
MDILVLGAGAWGTALAISAGARHRVTLRARDGSLAASLAQGRETWPTCRGSGCPTLSPSSGRPRAISRRSPQGMNWRSSLRPWPACAACWPNCAGAPARSPGSARASRRRSPIPTACSGTKSAPKWRPAWPRACSGGPELRPGGGPGAADRPGGRQRCGGGARCPGGGLPRAGDARLCERRRGRRGGGRRPSRRARHCHRPVRRPRLGLNARAAPGHARAWRR